MAEVEAAFHAFVLREGLEAAEVAATDRWSPDTTRCQFGARPEGRGAGAAPFGARLSLPSFAPPPSRATAPAPSAPPQPEAPPTAFGIGEAAAADAAWTPDSTASRE
jgi:hypothetical protein